MLVLRRKLDAFIVRALVTSSRHAMVLPHRANLKKVSYNKRYEYETIHNITRKLRKSQICTSMESKHTTCTSNNIQVHIQSLYNTYINYKTQKQRNYHNTETIKSIPGNDAILLLR